MATLLYLSRWCRKSILRHSKWAWGPLLDSLVPISEAKRRMLRNDQYSRLRVVPNLFWPMRLIIRCNNDDDYYKSNIRSTEVIVPNGMHSLRDSPTTRWKNRSVSDYTYVSLIENFTVRTTRLSIFGLCASKGVTSQRLRVGGWLSPVMVLMYPLSCLQSFDSTGARYPLNTTSYLHKSRRNRSFGFILSLCSITWCGNCKTWHKVHYSSTPISLL